MSFRLAHLFPIQHRTNYKLPELLKISRRQWSTKVKQRKNVEANDTSIKPPKRLSQQFKDPSILNLFPRRLLRQSSRKDITHFYLATESETPKKIATHLGNLPNLTIPFVETNPGPGLLTNLLVPTMKDLHIFESRKVFLQNLQDTYANVYPDRIKLQHADLLNHCVDNRFDKGKKVSEILSGLPITKWEDDINFRLYGATGSLEFFQNLIRSIIFQQGIMSYGRCELYMVIPAFTFIQLTSSNQAGYFLYRSSSILFQILFEYKVLDKFPSKDFLPQISHNCLNKRVKTKKIKDVDLELMYFVRIVPRQNLFQLCPEIYIQELWHFIQIHCVRRTGRIIPSLEKLIPFSGRRLLLNTQKAVCPQPIKGMNCSEISSITSPAMTLTNQDYYDNLNIYSQFGDLTPSQLFTLFYQFRSWPDYSSSTFLASLESALLKKKTTPYESSDIEGTEKAGNNLEVVPTDKESVE